MKKYVSMALILSQFCFASAGNCAQLPMSAEAQLLTRVIAIRGQNLPQEQWQQKTMAAFQEYANTPSAQADGRDQRLQEALVTTKIYTPDQASILMSQVQAAQNRIVGRGSAHQAQRQKFQAEMGQILHSMPQGAQFSSQCLKEVGDMELHRDRCLYPWRG